MQSMLMKHAAMKECIEENIPVFEFLLMDFNASIHVVFQDIIGKLNDLLYLLSDLQTNIKVTKINVDNYCSDMNNSIEDLEKFLDYIHLEYNIEKTYDDLANKLKNEKFVVNILVNETVKYTDYLITRLNKGFLKKIYIAIDGVPSLAKIKEQRNRRYIGAYIQRIKNDIESKYRINSNSVFQINLPFFKTMICAGTQMMHDLEISLKNLQYDVEISPMTERGEGEKKIMIKLEELENKYSSFCIMSPDSDMVILTGVLSKRPNLLKKNLYLFRIEYHNKNQFLFINQEKFVNNLINYYSKLTNMTVTREMIIHTFFMLFVFGNDFLPKLEPFDITRDFDFVCATSIKIAQIINFKDNNKLNYKYLLAFMNTLNQTVLKNAIDKCYRDKYTNYDKLCKSLSITSKDLQERYHHPSIKQTDIDFTTLNELIKFIKINFKIFVDYVKNNHIENINDFFYELHKDPDDSIMMLVLPRICKFANCNLDNDMKFFESLIHHLSANGNIQLRIKLFPKNSNYEYIDSGNLSQYLLEIQKFDRSQEPYCSMFGLKNIDLVIIDEQNDKFKDIRHLYYEQYVKKGMTDLEKNSMIESYLTGVEFLFRYYINNEPWDRWYYPWMQAPLIEDIVSYLSNLNDDDKFYQMLASLPKNTMTPEDNYYYVTPNDYTKKNISANLDDVIPYIRGDGSYFCNKAQIDWNLIEI